VQLLQRILDQANAEQRAIINYATPADKLSMLEEAEKLEDSMTFKELAKWAAVYISKTQLYRLKNNME
jgi:hypothetical protein